MDAGQLDQQILIEKEVTTKNELGEAVSSWVRLAKVSAKVIETPGREFLKGDFRPEGKAVFVIRFRKFDTTARVQWGGLTWDITGKTGTFREGWSYLHCISTDGAN